jgi:anti-sigma factor ChrR (cupin superfamily)
VFAVERMGVGVMISCREVSTLVSSDALVTQSWRRRVAVRLHLMMCAACRHFAAQIESIRRGAGAATHTFDDDAEGIEARAASAMNKSDVRRR